MSARLSADAWTRTRIWPRPGSGLGRCWSSSTSEPPGRVITTAFIEQQITSRRKKKADAGSADLFPAEPRELPNLVALGVPDFHRSEIARPDRCFDLRQVTRYDDDEIVGRESARRCPADIFWRHRRKSLAVRRVKIQRQ